MGMSDQENDSSQPPTEQQREMELTNDSLNNGENGDQQPHRPLQGQRPGVSPAQAPRDAEEDPRRAHQGARHGS